MSEERADSAAAISQWRVDCDDCDLEEDYPQEGTALGRMLAHSDVRGHSTRVREVKA